jgi:hypothetical protein
MTTLTILIAPGQGTVRLRGGSLEHVSEFPHDEGVHVRHISWLPEIEAELRPALTVASGGYTRAETPAVSEAESFLLSWRAATCPSSPVVLDDLALDSGENVLTGLMAARLALEGKLRPVRAGDDNSMISGAKLSQIRGVGPIDPSITIGRVVVLPAWRFKALRFTLTLEALGVDDYDVRGFAEAHEAQMSASAAWGEARGVAEIVKADDSLLLGANWEAKRRGRHGSSSYDQRFDGLRGCFPRTFAALDRARDALGQRTSALDDLRQAVREEILG